MFEKVPLAGTDYVDVRYYPLQSAGVSQSYDPSTGYNTANAETFGGFPFVPPPEDAI